MLMSSTDSFFGLKDSGFATWRHRIDLGSLVNHEQDSILSIVLLSSFFSEV